MDCDDITKTEADVEAFLERHVAYDLMNALRGELVPLLGHEVGRRFVEPHALARFDATWRGFKPIRPHRSQVVREMRDAWPQLTSARAQKLPEAQAVLSMRFAAWAWLLDDDAHAEAILVPIREALRPVIEHEKARAAAEQRHRVTFVPVTVDHNRMLRAVDRLARSWGLTLTEDEILAAAGGRHVH